MDTQEIQRIIRSYYKNMYSTKFENINIKENFQDKWNQDQVYYLNNSIPLKVAAVNKSIIQWKGNFL